MSEEVQQIDSLKIRSWIPERPVNAHKSKFGKICLIGGSMGMSGAITMSIKAALRSGVGLVTAYVPPEIHTVVALAVPEAMIYPLTDETRIEFNRFSAVLIGPGMGREGRTREIVEQALWSGSNLVLDADALFSIGTELDLVKSSSSKVWLTPHEGEAARLLGRPISSIRDERIGSARLLASDSGATLILKGAGTLVLSDGEILRNTTGNAGMAKGGSGDVLAGLLCGIIPQLEEHAAEVAVFLHGRAGDLAAQELSQRGMTPLDVIHKLPEAWRSIGLI